MGLKLLLLLTFLSYRWHRLSRRTWRTGLKMTKHLTAFENLNLMNRTVVSESQTSSIKKVTHPKQQQHKNIHQTHICKLEWE